MLASTTMSSPFSLAALALLSSSLVHAANHTIVVGGAAGKTYTPSNITAEVGDLVNFVFQSVNHTVTQSAFATPCNLLQNATAEEVGFDSGFVPVAANATSFPVWTIKVDVATPIWFYCRQTGHCEDGMVGAINAVATSNKSFAAFKALAISSTPASSVSGAPLSTISGATATGAGANGVASGSIAAADVTSPATTGYGASSGASTTASTGAASPRSTIQVGAVALAGIAAAVFVLA